MNGKISSGEVMAICAAMVFAMFPGFANTLILTHSKNASLISLVISYVIGLIPILMIMYISKKVDSNFFEFTKKNFKALGYILDIILLLLAIFTMFISSWLALDFIISQFLTRSSYYFIAILISIILAITVNKGVESLSRTIFLLFIISVPIILLLLLALIPYVELDNLKPYIDVNVKEIIHSSWVFLSVAISPVIYILGLKNITKDKKNFSRKIIIGYSISSFLIFVLLFFIISVYGIDLGSLLTYPVYGLFKKVQIFGFIERIENFAAIFLITAYFSQFAYLVYAVKNNISDMFKIKSEKKKRVMTYIIAIIIPLISIYLFKTYELTLFVKYVPYILSCFFIILIIVFIRSLFIKTTKAD